ncbi:uncharacterized protein RHOBADRAFT_44302 [Rhodotorula graminis WP1]|uniref:Aldehyde dehydrogenase domain-containing protein n=1 Tax=Rhodotorula graminis (strain WP1) TaxID=578459 RepID=A0A194S224_RHOGW|nr:uncharacterized protein RHOBADRAFT_44302 [Rhodotorula graminis WP1]KPV74783.1 hypothetical protein RHOBADRAFT_44302 [Rhodotorula graminis WP1]
MSNFPLAQYKAVHAAALDGSVAFPRFALDQLVKLFNIVSDERDRLQDALQRDTGVTAVEAQCELALTLSLVKRTVDEADYERQKVKKAVALKAEGRLEKGKGVVVVTSSAAAPIYSLVAPLAMAIATGNAVACFLPSSVPTISSLLQDVLSRALNRFAYLFTTAEPSSLASIDEAVRPRARTFTVSSGGEGGRSLSDTIVAAAGAAGATAVVDRLSPSSSPSQVADLARLLVRGKFHALGRLPGSVARVFVHEESAGLLLDALLRELENAFGRDSALSSDYGRLRGVEYDAPSLSKEKEAGGRVLCGGARSAGEDDDLYRPTLVSDPSARLLTAPASGAILPVQTFSSHEDLLYRLGELDSTVLYVFAPERAVVDYLATESTASAVYENDIPLDALYDPGSILTSPSHYLTTSRLFSTTSSSSRPPPAALFAPFTPSRLSTLKALFPREDKLVAKRTKHAHTIRRVFFLQGVFITLGTILTVLLGGTGWLGWAFL